jgi:hypothetical protein
LQGETRPHLACHADVREQKVVNDAHAEGRACGDERARCAQVSEGGATCASGWVDMRYNNSGSIELDRESHDLTRL